MLHQVRRQAQKLVCCVYFSVLRRSCASRTALRYLHCDRVLRMPCVTSDELLFFSTELQVVHSPSNDVRAAWRCAGKNIFIFPRPTQFLISLPSCESPSFVMLIPKCDWLLVDAYNGHLLTSGVENSSFATATQTSLRGIWFFCHHSSSACSVTRTGMTRSSNWKLVMNPVRHAKTTQLPHRSLQLKRTQKKLRDFTAHLMKVETK